MSTPKKFAYVYSNVIALQFTEATKTEVINWFSEELAADKLTFFNYYFDSFVSSYKFTYKYIDDSHNRTLEIGNYLVKQGDKLIPFGKVDFETQYGETADFDPLDSGKSKIAITGTVLQLIAEKSISGFSITGTGIKVGNDQYAQYIKINDVNAPSVGTPTADLGEYKTIEKGTQTVVTYSTAILSDEVDGTRKMSFLDDTQTTVFELNFSVGNGNKTVQITEVSDQLFLASGSQFVVNYADGAFYTKTITGSGSQN